MQEDNSRNILNIYFGKHFSKTARILFGRWIRAEKDVASKENLLFELWKQSSPEITEDTYTDWNNLRRHLYTIPTLKHFVPLYRRLIKYAAVISLLLIIASAAFVIMHRTAPPNYIEMAEFFVPYGESRMITLPDSSKVWVDAGSILVYPKDFSAINTRSVYLTGKASFKVKKNPEKPFIVKTTYMDVEALGTVFTVKSYPTEQYTTTTLERGSVRVNVKNGDGKSSVLRPNEQLVYSHKEHSFTIHQVDASLFGMERKGYLIFEDVSFNQLMSVLERKFNIVIQYNSQKYENEYYNVKFAPDESIEDVLNVLQQLTGLNYKIKKKVLFIN